MLDGVASEAGSSKTRCLWAEIWAGSSWYFSHALRADVDGRRFPRIGDERCVRGDRCKGGVEGVRCEVSPSRSRCLWIEIGAGGSVCSFLHILWIGAALHPPGTLGGMLERQCCFAFLRLMDDAERRAQHVRVRLLSACY